MTVKEMHPLSIYLSDAHSAEYVEEYEGALSVVVPHQVAVAEAL